MARPVEGSIDTVAGARDAGLSSGDTLSVRTCVTREDGRGVPASEGLIMELTLLTVPACPNAAAFEERLAAAVAGTPAVGSPPAGTSASGRGGGAGRPARPPPRRPGRDRSPPAAR